MASEITTRQKLVTSLIGATLTTGSLGMRLLPGARAWADGVEVLRDIPYKDDFGPQHTLDVYRPTKRDGPLPVLFYVHGGGFSLLSKDTHWMFGRGFARQGYVVFSIDYTLSGEAPFPAAAKDVFAAYQWVAERAVHYEGDASRMALAGESAGANLILALLIAQCWKRPEPWAAGVFEAAGEVGVAKAALPACGMLQVSNPERYLSMESVPTWMRDRIAVVCQRYLVDASGDPDGFSLADPLRFLEEAPPPDRPLPPMLAVCGNSDPIADDTRRLGALMKRWDNGSADAWWDGEFHAFHAFLWRQAAQEAWDRQVQFLKQHV